MANADGRPSGFDYMRLFLSVSVLLSHTGSTAYGNHATDQLYASAASGPLRMILPMFFALSGFLVAGSMGRCQTIVKFMGLRILRIYPALAVEVLLSALIIGPILTTLPLQQYFTDPQFWRYLVNATGHITFHLPGVFASNPKPLVVNGQLWTVPFELLSYISLGVLIILGAQKRRVLLPLGTAALLVLCALQAGYQDGWNFNEYYRPLRGPLLVACFLAGVTIHSYHNVIPMNGLLFAGSLISSLTLLSAVPNGYYISIIFIAYATVYLGVLSPRRFGIIKSADYSYGIFLYGYVVQQAAMAALPWAREWYWNFLVCLPASIIMAALSWHIVEKPAMKLKGLVTTVEARYLGFRAMVTEKLSMP